jgi:diguanylate cyclase (GGDEF)-like protein/PAS domain S-box-containing protein
LKLPIATRTVIAACAAGGLAVLAIAIHRLVVTGLPGESTVVIAVVFGLLIAGNRIRPLVVFIDEQSAAFDFDEGVFVVLLLLVPAAPTVIVFALATVVAEVITRRPLIKSVFNVGQVVTAVGIGLAVFELFDRTGGNIGYAKIGAAVAGAIVYFAMSNNAVAVLFGTLGSPWRETMFGGSDAKILVMLGSVAIGIPTALVVSRDSLYLPLAVVPLLLLRYLAAGHFYARHDRVRMNGLFEATLGVNRSMGNDETKEAILGAARSLLRSPEATLTMDAPTGDALGVPMDMGDQRLWLAVSGRSHTEPLDSADRTLLDALSSVGAIALTNTALYEEVQRQKERIAVITDSLGEGVCAVNGFGETTFMNPAGREMLGWTSSEAPLPPSTEQTTTEVAPHFLVDPAMRSMVTGTIVTSYDTRFQRRDGTYFPVAMTASPIVEGTGPTGAVIVFRDISERKAFEEELARHAFEDALTGLANRRLLLDHLDHALLRAERSGSQVAVIFCDLDRFKVVNDNLGHQAGDEFLRVVADRLRNSVRAGDILSRFGGDEFIVLLEDVTSVDGPNAVAQSILEALRDPVLLSSGHEVVATMSIGVALSTTGKSRDDLLHDADVAMYRAKDRGRGGQFAVFDVDAMGVRSTERVDLETALHHALDRDEVEVYYQPLFSLSDRRVVGAEALVRWNHPGHGLLLPAQFIQLAEENGAILPIGRAVLEEACHQARTWHDTLGVTLEVGVNLSARQFQRASLAEEIEEVLRLTKVDPAQLCLEITESLAMDDIELTTAILSKLHTLGVRLAIDDFGTGHSSLGYLARFPIDVVKIDQSFVSDIDRDPVKSAIVSAVVTLSQAVGSTTVVEGVETPAQLEHLRSLGCEVAQGFLFARPMTASAFGELLKSEKPARSGLRIVSSAERAG